MSLDAQTIRRAVWDLFKFNPKDFYVSACATGYLVSMVRKSAVAAVQPAFAFQLLDASDDSGAAIRVRYGTVESVVPDGMSLGDDPPYIITGIDPSGVVYLEVTTDSDAEITDVSIGTAASIPDDTYGEYHWEIGSWSTDDDSVLHIAQSIAGSQAFDLCGGAEPQWGLT